MPPTYYSTSVMPAAESWRAIRTLRAELSGSLERTLQRDAARRREFHMALEQAQQQFAAAARIGYESRPLNLFYGLSQAGRAVAAGSCLLGSGTKQQWRASGHGLKFDVEVPSSLFTTPVRLNSSTRDLFSRVSIAIGSTLDFGAIDFGAAVNQLVDYTMAFQEASHYPRPITGAHLYNVESKTFPANLEIHIPGLVAKDDPTAEQVLKQFAEYPALHDLEVAVLDDGRVHWSHNEDRCFVVVPSANHLKSSAQHGPAALAGAADYRGTSVLLPRAGSSDRALSPLMSWWVVLYALSMLARYAPSTWTKTLSLTRSRIASRIEFLLDSALDAVPELLWRELFRQTGGDPVPTQGGTA